MSVFNVPAEELEPFLVKDESSPFGAVAYRCLLCHLPHHPRESGNPLFCALCLELLRRQEQEDRQGP